MGWIRWLLEKFFPTYAKYEILWKGIFDVFILAIFVIIMVNARPVPVYICPSNFSTALNQTMGIINFTGNFTG